MSDGFANSQDMWENLERNSWLLLGTSERSDYTENSDGTITMDASSQSSQAIAQPLIGRKRPAQPMSQPQNDDLAKENAYRRRHGMQQLTMQQYEELISDPYQEHVVRTHINDTFSSAEASPQEARNNAHSSSSDSESDSIESSEDEDTLRERHAARFSDIYRDMRKSARDNIDISKIETPTKQDAERQVNARLDRRAVETVEFLRKDDVFNIFSQKGVDGWMADMLKRYEVTNNGTDNYSKKMSKKITDLRSKDKRKRGL